VPIIHPAPYTIAIEAGHGGPYYWGGSTRDSDGNLWIEKDAALEIALRLSERLDADERYVPILIRGDCRISFDAGTTGRANCGSAGADVANAVNAGAYVSMPEWVAGPSRARRHYQPDRSFGGDYGLALRGMHSAVHSRGV
jgi:N-acetylmuramoyl-L-alanine amidase